MQPFAACRDVARCYHLRYCKQHTRRSAPDSLSAQSTLHTSFPRDLAAGRYLDLFVVGGVSAVLAIRFILRITGYPSVGGARFHIAHMLWGGLLMLIFLRLADGALADVELPVGGVRHGPPLLLEPERVPFLISL